MKNKNNIIVIILIILVIGLTIGGVYFLNNKKSNNNNNNNNTPSEPEPTPSRPSDFDPLLGTEFNLNMIKMVNSKEADNYLISTYSMEIALNMLREGAANETLNQFNTIVPKRNITHFDVKNRISVANGLFIRESEKGLVRDSYIETLKTAYKSDLIYDKFDTPKKINDWVNEKTYEMIPKILDTMSKDFVLGLANAVAIDVEWNHQFECQHTRSEEFTKTDGKKVNVEMMNESYTSNVKYINNENEQGIILPYASYKANGEKDYANLDSSTQLEFVAIMPTNTNIRTYINELTGEKLNNTLNSFKDLNNQDLNLSLPRFEYSYDDKHFKDDLKALGITDVFDRDKADLGRMKNENSPFNLYVSQAIHMTYISLNEKGTRAAAVTYFGVEKATAMPPENEIININFNKPFMYMIRDSKTKEMLFFGVVESPNEWKGSTCENK